jgi:putative ABC transport system substrate-binding protein
VRRLVASLNRPGGNVTGVSLNSAELPGKVLGLLREMVPQATTIAYLASTEERKSVVLAAAPALGRQVIVLEARRSDRDFEAAFATLVARRAGALAVQNSPLFTNNREKLLALAARHKIPTIYSDRVYTLDGGLMSYGASVAESVARSVSISAGFSRATSPPICHFSYRPGTSW